MVKEMADKIIFLHQVIPGGASKSYGIEAGRLAGLPPSVIKRARQVMGQIEKHSKLLLVCELIFNKVNPLLVVMVMETKAILSNN